MISWLDRNRVYSKGVLLTMLVLVIIHEKPPLPDACSARIVCCRLLTMWRNVFLSSVHAFRLRGRGIAVKHPKINPQTALLAEKAARMLTLGHAE
jgi:hypothetical protein